MVKLEEQRIDEEIKRREDLISQFPKEIADKVKELKLMPGEIEIKIAQRNGLFIDIKRKKEWEASL